MDGDGFGGRSGSGHLPLGYRAFDTQIGEGVEERDSADAARERLLYDSNIHNEPGARPIIIIEENGKPEKSIAREAQDAVLNTVGDIAATAAIGARAGFIGLQPAWFGGISNDSDLDFSQEPIYHSSNSDGYDLETDGRKLYGMRHEPEEIGDSASSTADRADYDSRTIDADNIGYSAADSQDWESDRLRGSV